MYLQSFYTLGQKIRGAKSNKTVAETSLRVFLYNFLQQNMIDAYRYRAIGVDLVHGFRDHEILASVMSWRDGLRLALPKLSRVADPAYVEHLDSRLSNTAELYAFRPNTKAFLLMANQCARVAPTNMHALIKLAKRGTFDIEQIDKDPTIIETFVPFMKEHGRSMGASISRVIAAAQDDETKTTNILQAYKTGAAHLAKRLKAPAADAGQAQRNIHRLSKTFLQGMQTGMTEECERSMQDRNAIFDLRRMAQETIRLARS
jgi:hypothetical protein